MENVKSLSTLKKFADVRSRLILRFQEAGYKVTTQVLNARDFGVPQGRERVFFVGVQEGLQPIFFYHFLSFTKKAPTLRDLLVPLGRPGTKFNERVCNAKITLAAKPILRKSPYAGMLFNGQGRPLNPDGWANTLPASMGGNRTPIIYNRHLYYGADPWVEAYHRHLTSGGKPHGMHDAPSFLRRLTISEAALLQTFPSDYVFHGPDSKVFLQIGNAVPCTLAKVVAKCVLASLNDNLTSVTPVPPRGHNLELALA